MGQSLKAAAVAAECRMAQNYEREYAALMSRFNAGQMILAELDRLAVVVRREREVALAMAEIGLARGAN